MLPGGAATSTFVPAKTARRRSPGLAVGSAADEPPTTDPQSGSLVTTGLAKQGTVLTGFRQISPSSIANRIALVTGQAPNADTLAGCSTALRALPQQSDDFEAGQQAVGDGCIYDSQVADIFSDGLQTYSERIAVYSETGVADYHKAPGLCAPPAVGSTVVAPANGGPDPRDNPFLWLSRYTGVSAPGESVNDFCKSQQRPLERLAADIAADEATPDCAQPAHLGQSSKCLPPLVFILPSRCRGGAAATCPDKTPGGPQALDSFVKSAVEGTVMKSSAYRRDGLAMVGWDRLPDGAGPKSPSGLLLLSPFVKKGATDSRSYTTYDQLLTIATRLGYANFDGGATGLANANPNQIGVSPMPREFSTANYSKALDVRAPPQ
jgi:hypothetical protein